MCKIYGIVVQLSTYMYLQYLLKCRFLLILCINVYIFLILLLLLVQFYTPVSGFLQQQYSILLCFCVDSEVVCCYTCRRLYAPVPQLHVCPVAPSLPSLSPLPPTSPFLSFLLSSPDLGHLFISSSLHLSISLSHDSDMALKNSRTRRRIRC